MSCKHTNKVMVGYGQLSPTSRPPGAVYWCRCCGALRKRWKQGQDSTWRKARHEPKP